MSRINKFKCDYCNKTVDAYYNGEHHLPPRYWASIYDETNASKTGEHICNNCLPSTRQNKHKKTKGKK